ncbi:hypothetical protein CCACVL1_01450, partial [Corchorus capsularis]
TYVDAPLIMELTPQKDLAR